MTLPVEIIIWIGGGILLFLSFVAHLQIRILSKVSLMDKHQAISNSLSEERYAALKRHNDRNEAEIIQLNHFVRRHSQ